VSPSVLLVDLKASLNKCSVTYLVKRQGKHLAILDTPDNVFLLHIPLLLCLMIQHKTEESHDGSVHYKTKLFAHKKWNQQPLLLVINEFRLLRSKGVASEESNPIS
jgi:hypothetical protein